jgi:hypothetical protein
LFNIHQLTVVFTFKKGYYQGRTALDCAFFGGHPLKTQVHDWF